MSENKNEGKLKILEMLAEGKITVEQSMELLAQFPDEKKNAGYMDPRQINPNKRKGKRDDDYDYEYDEDDDDDEESDFVEDLSNLGRRIKEGIEDAIGTDFASIGAGIKESLEDLDDVDINIDIGGVFGYHKYKSSMTYISNPIPQSISALRLLGKNSGVEIKGYDGNQLRITCKFNAKRSDAQVFVNEDNGSFEVLYDYNAMRSMKIYAEVPRVLIENIHAETKNANVDLYGVKARHVNLLTKNSSIRIGDVNCEEIVARTRNSAIKADRLNATAIDFETSNSKISTEDTTAQTARLTTSNSKVVTENCNIQQLFVKTTNASIKMENVFKGTAGQGDWDAERIVEAHTTNGNVAIYVPRDVAAMVQASTSHGRVDCELQSMMMDAMSRHYINGKSINYDTAARKAKINVSTTNSAIKIREA
ncbi:MAG: DUF4097 family beta strand repeat-containing protein [Defluviitaleaceae bacterium]|nr:DUF4097 family beta strand repeat-containing protein [Defluviitaleaceae bacterium]